MTKGVVFSLVVVVVAVAAWVIFRDAKELIAPVLTSPSPVVSGSPASRPSTTPIQQSNLVTYMDSGYSPATITIKKGQTVVWKNESSKKMWTASAMHPTHKVYPGTDITACGTQTLMPMFDACAGTVPGENWSFKFDNAGTWKYHNHMNSSHYGTVVVE